MNLIFILKIMAIGTTYYFGQIAERYRGNLALFLESTAFLDTSFKPAQERQVLTLRSFSLNSDKLSEYTNQNEHWPARAYLGVNKQAEIVSEQKLKENGDNDLAILSLDCILVRPDVLRKRQEGLFKAYSNAVQTAINTTKNP